MQNVDRTDNVYRTQSANTRANSARLRTRVSKVIAEGTKPQDRGKPMFKKIENVCMTIRNINSAQAPVGERSDHLEDPGGVGDSAKKLMRTDWAQQDPDPSKIS